ncbi:MAG: hypothetical protein HY691_17330 [Chloroflexi bacterium]|nr:hypothetical protein [Chloroflexota bacterium]
MHQLGRDLFVTGETREAALARAEEMVRRRQRQGISVRLDPEPIHRRDPVFFQRRGGPVDASPMRLALTRLAAKVAIEYIALRGGHQVAIGASLDSLRSCAIEGTAIEGAEVAGSSVYLPRKDIRLLFGTDQNSLEDLRSWKPDSQEALRSKLGDVVPLRTLVHHISIMSDGTHAYFELVLFSVFGVLLGLPPSLPLRWGRYDYRDLTRCRTGWGLA